MTLEQLAELSGYALSTISSVENGHHIPNPRFVERLADVLGARLEWIETGEGEMFGRRGDSGRIWFPLVDNYTDQLKEIAEIFESYAIEMGEKAKALQKQAKDFEDFAREQAKRAAARAEQEKRQSDGSP